MNKHSFHLFRPGFCHVRSTNHGARHLQDRTPLGNCTFVEKFSKAALPSQALRTPVENRNPEVQDLLPWLGWLTT
ncbi:hypothetical protein ARZXY2_4593 (plasmid) [Arthrobacter sp. ZXY-2]|nr:hypothetical protein ARZXY2_4593 [Arthrobacter sp. ZXY-2]